MSERLELVTNFAELRAGMTVIDIACGVCGRVLCRGRLTELVEAEESEQGYEAMAWEAVPYCGDPRDGHFNGIDAKVVRQRRIFRVVDEPPAETTTVTRKLERVR